jgi:hypothetical protein
MAWRRRRSRCFYNRNLVLRMANFVSCGSEMSVGTRFTPRCPRNTRRRHVRSAPRGLIGARRAAPAAAPKNAENCGEEAASDATRDMHMHITGRIAGGPAGVSSLQKP